MTVTKCFRCGKEAPPVGDDPEIRYCKDCDLGWGCGGDHCCSQPKRFVPNPEDFDFGDPDNDAEPEDWPPTRMRALRPERPVGKYLVIHEGETPQQMVAEEFDDLDSAIAFARNRWGGGEYLKLETPDGSNYDFGGDMRERINLVRVRKEPLNPKQQLGLEKWGRHPELRKWIDCLELRATTPTSIYNCVKDDEGRRLLVEALSSGLLEIIDWTDGGPFPDREWIDRYLEEGRARSI